MNNLNTPPIADPGQVAVWNESTSQWTLETVAPPSWIPPAPENIPTGYKAELENSQWVIKEIIPPVIPVLTPEQKLLNTTGLSVAELKTLLGL